MKKKFDD